MSQIQEVWTVLKILNWTQEFFKSKHIESARLDAEILLARVLKCERIFLYVNYEQPLMPSELAEFKAMILQRVAGQSIAYILGEKQFMHYTLKVTPAVLVPRPETELLVEEVLNCYDNRPLQVLDMCTGSGAIGLALAGYRSEWQVTCSDVSAAALAIAGENADSLGLSERIRFVESDMFAQLPPEKYQALIANPPYIPLADKKTLSKEVLAEPHLALFAADEGLRFYKIIAAQAAKYLETQGRIFLEFGIGQAAAIERLFRDQGYKEILIKKDYAGIDRMMVIN